MAAQIGSDGLGNPGPALRIARACMARGSGRASLAAPASTARLHPELSTSTLAVAASCLFRPSRWRAMLLVALAGLLHGLAHGSESGAHSITHALPFILGMMVSTLMLHLGGMLLGRLLQARSLAWRIAPSFLGSLMMPQPAMAQGTGLTAELGDIEVQGNYDNAVGSSDTASAGRVNSQLLSTRPPLRPAEILEYVPGLIVTQHSGDGKANQYLLRGFNLDHGTDFATHVDGMPVNLPTHAHGHGYTDLNSLTPRSWTRSITQRDRTASRHSATTGRGRSHRAAAA